MYKQPFIVLFTTIDILVDNNIPNIFLSVVAQIYKMSWGKWTVDLPFSNPVILCPLGIHVFLAVNANFLLHFWGETLISNG